MSPKRRKLRASSAIVARNLMLAPAVMALRTPMLAAEAGGFAPVKEMAGAINEKTAAFMEGLAAAQFAWLHSAVMLPVAYAKARSPFTPLLDMAETVTSAALAPAGRRVRRNHRRLSKS